MDTSAISVRDDAVCSSKLNWYILSVCVCSFSFYGTLMNILFGASLISNLVHPFFT